MTTIFTIPESCIKCGDPNILAKYNPPKQHAHDIFDKEFLTKTCSMCGYSWQCPCHDAKGSQTNEHR